MKERVDVKVSIAIGLRLDGAPTPPGVEREILSGMRPQDLIS